MADDLQRLENWLSPLLHRLQPGERRKLAREVARLVRGANQKTMAAQTSPEGAAWEPRKNRSRDTRGKLRQGPLFRKLRTARYLKALAFADAAVVQFMGRAERLARVHHYGLRDYVSPGGAQYDYPARPLLGITPAQLEQIRDVMISHLAGAAGPA
jgi:phage virion morphogenesis protein